MLDAEIGLHKNRWAQALPNEHTTNKPAEMYMDPRWANALPQMDFPTKPPHSVPANREEEDPCHSTGEVPGASLNLKTDGLIAWGINGHDLVSMYANQLDRQ